MISIDLKGKIALVTGSSRGIGQEILCWLAQGGATVIGTATTEPGAAAISQTLQERGWSGTGKKLDVTNETEVASVLEFIQNEYGTPGILVNNAGITRDNLLLRMKEEEWDAVMATNLKGVFRLSKAVLRGMMKEREGRIINIGSVVGGCGNAGQTNYAAAKAGLLGFTKALALEVGSRGITVNCVAPGFIETDMTKTLTTEQHQALQQKIPLGRLGQVGDIAAAVLFLASPGAAYITGTTLHVNGGMYLS